MPVELQINTRESDTGTAIRTIRFFNEVKLSMKYDSVASTFSFVMYYDPANKEHAEIAGVSHYHEAIIKYAHTEGEKELLLTGYILSQLFKSSSKKEPLAIGGYSKAGLLEDCDVPPELYPLESNGLTFRQIVNKVISKFGGKKGIKFIVENNRSTRGISDSAFKTETERVDASIPKSTAPESRNIKAYLTELATQKNIILSHNPEGNLVVSTANTDGTPILDIDADSSPSVGFVGMTLNYNGQAIHSHITVVRQADDEGGNSAKHTIANPLCPIVYRPKVVQLTSGDDISITEAATHEVSKELKNINLTIELDRAVINGKFIRPNNTISVKNRDIYLYNKTRWFIESVEYTQSAQKESVILTCALPWVYNYYATNPNGKKSGPYNIFIDPHKNLPRV